MKTDTFHRYMARIAAAFPTVTVKEQTPTVYYEALHHLDDDVFMEAIRRCLQTREWFPTIAAILQEAEEVLADAGRIPPNEEWAWRMVLNAISGDGKIEDQHVRRVAREFGLMRDLKTMSAKDLRFLEDKFKKQYGMERTLMLRYEPEWMTQGLQSTRVDSGTDGLARLAELNERGSR